MEKLALLTHSRIANVVVGVLLAMVWGIFVSRHIAAYVSTGMLAYLVFCFSESLQAILFLVRSMPKTISLDPFDWLVAFGGTFAPLLLLPGGMIIWSGGEVMVLIGVVLQIMGLFSLNRSFALVAAKREIKTGGLYRFVRHPLYASYVLAFVGYALFNATVANVALLMFAFVFLSLRIVGEEKHLLADPDYQVYCTRVRWRLLPFVY